MAEPSPNSAKAGSKILRRSLQIVFVLAVTALSWFNLPAALVAMLATVFVVMGEKLETIVELSFGPLRAKLERTVSESEDLIEGLRKLALAQSKALVSASAHTGRFATKDGWIFHASKDIESGLRSIGASEEEIVVARSDLIRLTLRDLGATATNGSLVPSFLGDAAVLEWKEFRRTDQLCDPNFLEKWLKEQDVFSSRQQEIVKAMRWIIQHQDIRDEEQYLLAKDEIRLVKQDEVSD